jgi:flagellar biosynthesis anti-sigma factor FlgM
MRIDSNQEAQRALASERESETIGSQQAANGDNAVQNTSSALGEDQAELSGFHGQVQALVAQVSELPETSQGRIDALRQAVVSGKYQPSADQVAAALFSNMAKLAA